MRSEFSGYFPVSEAQLNKLWAGALIVVDANTLLNLYRYNEGAREAMLRALEILKDRLWIPYQVAHEFHTNRPSVIRTQEQVPTVIRDSLDQISNYIKSQLGPHKRNGVLDVVDMMERLEDTVSDLRSSAAKSKFGSTPQSDRIVERLADILDGRTGPKFSTKQHATEVEAGHQRIAENTPPGLRDANKAGDKAVGDYLLWRQLMNFSKSQGHDVLFVTDDRKDDWWWTQAGYTLGPLPALREEFARETGQFIWFYRPARFLAELRTRNLSQVSDDDISAVRETSDRSGVSHRERPISASSLVDLEARRSELLAQAVEGQDRLKSASSAYLATRRRRDDDLGEKRKRKRIEVSQLRRARLLLSEQLESDNLSASQRESMKLKLTDNRLQAERIAADLDQYDRMQNAYLSEAARAGEELENVRSQNRRIQEELAEVESTLDRYYLPPD